MSLIFPPVRISTTAQAQAGTDNASVMTPLTTAQAIPSVPFAASGSLTPRSLARRCVDVLNAFDFGAVGDGNSHPLSSYFSTLSSAQAVYASAISLTDEIDGVAINAMLAALPASGGVVLLGSGSFLATVPIHFPNSPVIFQGLGMEVTKLVWKKQDNLLYRAENGLGTYSDLALEDFQVVGTWLTNQSSDTTYFPIDIHSTDRLRISRVAVRYSQSMNIVARNCRYVTVENCRISESARDGINVEGCTFVKIVNNEIDHIDDDAIAVHTTTAYSTAVHQGVVISGNRISDAQGIKVNGGRRIAITGNQIERCRQGGIEVQFGTVGGDTVGYTTPLAIQITGNVITDVFDRLTLDALNSGANYIQVSCSKSAGSGAAVPGLPALTTGTFVPAYANFDNNGTAVALSPSQFINISDNILARTLPSGVNYSSLGYGQMFTRTGYIDPALTEAMLGTTSVGVIFAGGGRRLRISDNEINGQFSSIYFSGGGADWEDIQVCDNILSDFGRNNGRGITFDGGVTGGQCIVIRGNMFDGDPEHASSNRGAAGVASEGWLANGDPTGILIQSASGLLVEQNTFKRLCRPSDIEPTAGSNQVIFRNNYIEALPHSTGFGLTNFGVGNCPAAGERFSYRYVINDPTLSTYNSTSNNMLNESNAKPSSGSYLPGHIVRNNSATVLGTAGSQYIITGWYRLTFGGNHVLNTDWIEMHALTGT